jgi:hypothetical protein
VGELDERVVGLLERLREAAELVGEVSRLAARAASLGGASLQLRQPELVPGAEVEVSLPRGVDVAVFDVERGAWQPLGKAEKAVFKAAEGCVVLELVGRREEAGQPAAAGEGQTLLKVSLCRLTVKELVVLARSLGEEDWERVLGELRRIHGALAEYVEALERVAAVARLVL